VKVEFRKSFEKELGKIRDEDLLVRIKAVIEEVENAESLPFFFTELYVENKRENIIYLIRRFEAIAEHSVSQDALGRNSSLQVIYQN